MNKTIFFISLLFLGVSCIGSYDSEYFNGTVKLIGDLKKINNVKGTKVDIDETAVGYFAVHDTLAFFMNDQYPKGYYRIFSLSSGKMLGEFCTKGGGPEESYGISPICNFFVEDGELKTLLFAPNQSKMMLWNITVSLREGVAVYDTIVRHDWKKEHLNAYSDVFYGGNDTLLAYDRGGLISLDDMKTEAPYFLTKTLYDNRMIREYDVFRKTITNKTRHVLAESFYAGNNCPRPDNKKLASCMLYLNQINILDLESGEVVGYRIKGSPGFEIFKTDMSAAKLQFTKCQVDRDYIYGLYMGEEDNPRYIHVFDWQGNMVKKLDLGRYVHQIWLDREKRLLYTYDNVENEMYRYDLNQILPLI